MNCQSQIVPSPKVLASLLLFQGNGDVLTEGEQIQASGEVQQHCSGVCFYSSYRLLLQQSSVPFYLFYVLPFEIKVRNKPSKFTSETGKLGV